MPQRISPESGANAGSKLFRAEGLGHVIVGAEIERLDLAGLIGAAREHDDRDLRAARAHRREHFEPANPRRVQRRDEEDPHRSAHRPVGQCARHRAVKRAD